MADDYPSNWDSLRKRAYERDNYKCQNCGAKGGPRGDAELHAHHSVPRSKGGADKLSNLITHCKGCHKAIHSNNRQAPTGRQDRISVSYDDERAGPLKEFFIFFGVWLVPGLLLAIANQDLLFVGGSLVLALLTQIYARVTYHSRN